MEPIYLEYLAADVIATRQSFSVLYQRTRLLLDESEETWGYVSDEWMRDCIKRFGSQTHHIQLRSSIVLRAITANGLHLDTARRNKLKSSLEALVEKQKAKLRKFGYLPGGKGAKKSLQAVLSRRARKLSHLSFPLTESGQYATAHGAIIDLADADPFVKLLLEYSTTEKLLGSFAGKMAKPVLHLSFKVLARSGRTDSFGEINAQNLPTSDAVRTCFTPRSGYVCINADYSTIELATLAQACLTQFGLESKMADAINNGADLHELVAARVLGKSPAEVSNSERQKAKPANFGKPGGMGTETLTAYAKANYRVTLSIEEAETLSESWFGLFPEMRAFLTDKSDLVGELAALLDLTPSSHFESTVDRRFINHPENAGYEYQPHPILGAMLLKVVKEPNPVTQSGKPYSSEDCDHFWSRLDSIVDQFPIAQQKAIAARRPSRKLQRAVMGLVGRARIHSVRSSSGERNLQRSAQHGFPGLGRRRSQTRALATLACGLSNREFCPRRDVDRGPCWVRPQSARGEYPRTDDRGHESRRPRRPRRCEVCGCGLLVQGRRSCLRPVEQAIVTLAPREEGGHITRDPLTVGWTVKAPLLPLTTCRTDERSRRRTVWNLSRRRRHHADEEADQ